MKKLSVLLPVVLICIAILCTSCKPASTFEPISGFSDEANEQLAEVFDAIAEQEGEVVVAFDWGKTINHYVDGSGYMSHEAVIMHAEENPEKAEAANAVIEADAADADDYFILRSSVYWTGVSADDVSTVGYEAWEAYFEIYPAMHDLIQQLQAQGVTVLIISNGDFYTMYKVVEEELGLDPETSLYAYRSDVDSSGVCTGELLPPMGEGSSKDAILAGLLDGDLLMAGGDSALSSDGPMMDMAKFQLVVNPKDEDIDEILDRWPDAILVYPQ